MPVSVVVGGQYGSEGKGKVALHIARQRGARAVVRVGGTNSGHSAVDPHGQILALRQLPVSGLADGAVCVLPPGSFIDTGIFLAEIKMLGLEREQILVDPAATVISEFDKEAEAASDLIHKIGSTGSGTGAALVRRMQRDSEGPPVLARDHPSLAPFLRPTLPFLTEVLRANESIVIEGTQGFGLSLLHGGYWPKSTSRDTTAAAFLSETGISMRAVDDIVLVLRTYPIRVGGDSGPMPHEIDWPTLAREAGLASDYCELATATKRVRRVARFDPALPARAVASNGPHRIVLNHLDYVDSKTRDGILTQRAGEFIRMVEAGIGQRVDLVGTGPGTLLDCSELRAAA